MRYFLLRAVILTLCWSLVYAPVPPAQAWAPKSPSAAALGQLNQLAGLELQATSLMSSYNAAFKTFDQLFFEAFMMELDPWLQENLPKLLADESPPAPPLPPEKPSTKLSAAPVVSALGKPSVAKPLGTMAPPAPVDAVTPPPGVDLNTLSPEKIAALQAAWSALQTKAQQLNAVEELLNAYPPLLYPLYAKMKDEQTALDAGVLRFLQITVHTVTRRIVGDAVKSPFPEVQKLDGCQGGLMGSHAFYQALQAAADGSDTLGQGEVQKLLHQQHACLDPQTSLRHEIAYVAALESVEGELQKNNLSHWYPKFAAANVAVVLTLWDGKQWWGPTPYYNWLTLNQPAIVPALSNAPGLYAFDRTANAMAKLHLCGNAPAAAAVGNNAGTVKKKPAPLAHDLKRAGAVLKAPPYQKNVYQGTALPPAIDPNLSYTPYGIPWSGDEKDWCTGEQFIPVAPIQAACLEPQVLLDRLTDPKAWGLGNCTIEEFVNAGLICPPPRGQCAAPYGLKDPKLKPVPAIPFALSHGKTLLQCLVANVQPPQDPILKCAAQTSGGKGSGGGGFVAAAAELGDGRGKSTSGLRMSEFGGSGQAVYTPGSKSCGFNPVGDDTDGGDGGDGTDADASDGEDTNKTDDDDADEKKKKEDDVKTTVSPDGTTKTYDFPPQDIQANPGAEGPTAQGKRGIDTGGPPGGTDRTAPPSSNGKDPAWMDTPEAPKGGTRNGSSGGSSNGSTDASSKTTVQPGGTPHPETSAFKWPSEFVAWFDNMPVEAMDSAWLQQFLQDHFAGSAEKLQQAAYAVAEQARQIAMQPQFRKRLWQTLNQVLIRAGIDPIPEIIFDSLFTSRINSGSYYGPLTVKFLWPTDPSYFDSMWLQHPGSGLETAKFLGLTHNWMGGDGIYEFPAVVLAVLLSKKKWHQYVANLFLHEFLHRFGYTLIQDGLLPKYFKNLNGFDSHLDTLEHIWIYKMEDVFLKSIPAGMKKNGMLQSSFDPKNFPPGPDGTQQPGTMVAGDIAFISVGPKVHDADGVHDRYPDSAAMCADDFGCGGSCTVGQAQASAFNDCILQAAGTSGGGGTVAPAPGGPDPSPMDESVGSLPACADEGFGGTDEDNSSCVAADCPADNPDCCKKKTGSGAPWAIDPSLTMQQCYAMYCGEGQADCPCGGTASSKSWFMKGQSATQPAPVQKTIQPANKRGQQKSLPGNP